MVSCFFHFWRRSFAFMTSKRIILLFYVCFFFRMEASMKHRIRIIHNMLELYFHQWNV